MLNHFLSNWSSLQASFEVKGSTPTKDTNSAKVWPAQCVGLYYRPVLNDACCAALDPWTLYEPDIAQNCTSRSLWLLSLVRHVESGAVFHYMSVALQQHWHLFVQAHSHSSTPYLLPLVSRRWLHRIEDYFVCFTNMVRPLISGKVLLSVFDGIPRSSVKRCYFSGILTDLRLPDLGRNQKMMSFCVFMPSSYALCQTRVSVL